MSVLWVLPLAFVAVGVLIVTVALRQSAAAAAELRDECVRLEEVRLALVDLHSDADLTRAAIERVRARSKGTGPDR